MVVRKESYQEQFLDFIEKLIKETTNNREVIETLHDQSTKQLDL